MRVPETGPGRPRTGGGAQQDWKRGWTTWLGRSLLVAVALHAGVFTLWPQFRIDDRYLRRGEPVNAMYLAGVAEVRAPAPPGELARPALPEVEALELAIPDDIAGPLPVFTAREIVELPTPPVAGQGAEWAAYHRFAPTMVRPEIRNLGEVRRFLLQRYQPLLDRTGARGTVEMRFWIDEGGVVRRAELDRTSGLAPLDALAVELSGILRFRPATRRGAPVAVQVVLPIEFRELS